MRHRLLGMRCYLCGAMDRVADGGVNWRRNITPWLVEHGVSVLDPACKPMENGIGDESDRQTRRQWVENEQYDQIAAFMKRVRGIDLRMVNIVDFLIVKVDPDVHMCGSYEEVAIANHEKKPILVWVEGGKKRTPWWLFGQIPHQHIFGSRDDLLAYLEHVDTTRRVKTYRRWFFFRFDGLHDSRVLAPAVA